MQENEEAKNLSPEAFYTAYMENIKFRIQSLLQVIQKELSFPHLELEYEFCAVQLRKMLEMIAFSSLVANKEKYADTYNNFAKDWRVKGILEKIEKINSDFYPRPAKLIKKADESYHVEHKKPTESGIGTPLTREEFVELYDICSKILHIKNPYHPESNKIDLKYTFDQWLKKICLLLDTHIIRLVEGEAYWIIRMQVDGKVEIISLGPALPIEDLQK